MNQRIALQKRAVARDAEGDEVTSWTTVHDRVPAGWLPGPGRELLAAEAVRAQTVGRFVIGWLPGVGADWRALWNGQALALTAPPLDPGDRTQLTLLVAAGVAHDGT